MDGGIINLNMNNKIYEEIESNCSKTVDRKSWNELAVKYDYSCGEALRASYRREKNRREENRIEKKNDNVRIAVFDIENSPLQVFAFQLWDVNISPDQIISDTFLFSWSAKLLNEPKIYGQVLTSEEAKNKDDERIVKGIWEFLNECHILIGHNIKSFDLAKLNVRFLYHELPPLSNSQIIDTLQIARANFAFSSNKLGYINKQLNIKQKIENEGFNLWRKCFEGQPDALQTMFEYNKGDVVSTEDLYYKIRPFVKNHPNLALYNEIDEMQCPNCGSLDLADNGWYYTSTGKYQSLRCGNCGAISRKRKDEIEKDKKKNVLRN